MFSEWLLLLIDKTESGLDFGSFPGRSSTDSLGQGDSASRLRAPCRNVQLRPLKTWCPMYADELVSAYCLQNTATNQSGVNV